MEFKLFFEEVSDELTGQRFEATDLGNFIVTQYENLEDTSFDIALIGVKASCKMLANSKNSTDEIRRKFYCLKRGKEIPNIIDLGNLCLADTPEQTYGRIREVCEMLIQYQILPVILGATHDLDIGQYQAYEDLNKLVYLATIDNTVDIASLASDAEHNHLNTILLHQPNYLFSFGILGFQGYLINGEKLRVFEKLNFDAVSVGQIRSNLPEIEPVIRSADLLSFDISAIRQNDVPASRKSTPFGLTGEEAGQICWYAGTNEQLSSVGIYGYDADTDTKDFQTAFVIAVMLWYFVEGFYHRKGNLDLGENFHIKYTVPMPQNFDLIFYKNKLSDMWWLEVPVEGKKSQNFDRQCVVPCSYNDFQQANQGHLPDRWLKGMIRKG